MSDFLLSHKIGSIMKINLILLTIFLLALSTLTVSAQRTESLILENGVSPHVGLDKTYRRFSESYSKFDVDMAADVYTKDTVYFQAGKDIKIGNKAVREIFSQMFTSVKKQDVKLHISFRVLRREIGENLVGDEGIYSISYSKDGKTLGASKGRFIVVGVKDQDGKWRFRSDVSMDYKEPKKKK